MSSWEQGYMVAAVNIFDNKNNFEIKAPRFNVCFNFLILSLHRFSVTLRDDFNVTKSKKRKRNPIFYVVSPQVAITLERTLYASDPLLQVTLQ